MPDRLKKMLVMLAVCLFEVGGLYLIGRGLYMIFPPLGWIFCGVVAVKIGYSLFRDGQEDKQK